MRAGVELVDASVGQYGVGQGALVIRVDQKDALSRLSEVCGQVRTDRRFADAALEVEYADDRDAASHRELVGGEVFRIGRAQPEIPRIANDVFNAAKPPQDFLVVEIEIFQRLLQNAVLLLQRLARDLAANLVEGIGKAEHADDTGDHFLEKRKVHPEVHFKNAPTHTERGEPTRRNFRQSNRSEHNH